MSKEEQGSVGPARTVTTSSVKYCKYVIQNSPGGACTLRAGDVHCWGGCSGTCPPIYAGGDCAGAVFVPTSTGCLNEC
jgi:hypothetical protein